MGHGPTLDEMTRGGVTARQAQRLAAVDWAAIGRALGDAVERLADALVAAVRRVAVWFDVWRHGRHPTYWHRTTRRGMLGHRRAYRGIRQYSKHDQWRAMMAARR